MHLAKRGMRILFAVLTAGALTAGGLGATSASAATTATTDPNAVAVHQTSQSPAAVRAYWTPARLKSAKAIDGPGARSVPAGAPKQTSRLGRVSAAGAAAKGAQPGSSPVQPF